MEIKRNYDRKTLDVSVDGYILNVLERFSMLHANGRTTPTPVDGLCTKRDCPDPNTEAGRAGQTTIATSTAEAEYIAAFEATKEAIYLRRLMSELGQMKPADTVTLNEDSQACIKIATNPCLAERTKHFDIKYHWLRDKVKEKAVELRYISTHDQIADLLTKSLGPRQHAKLRTQMTGM